MILTGTSAYAMQPSKARVVAKSENTGVYFEIEISSADNPPMLWKNWRDSGKYYGETALENNSSMIIIKDGYSYSLSPEIKVARKSKLVLDEKKNPMAGKYAPLADIPQIDPAKYVSLINDLGARMQGPTTLPDGKRTQLYSLEIPDDTNFPWDKFMIWIDIDRQLPAIIEYSEKGKKRKLTFKKIETNKKIEESRFDVPDGYKLIVFEWD